MHTFIRAVVTGFGFSLGSALYKKVSKKLGLDDEAGDKQAPPLETEAGEEEVRADADSDDDERERSGADGASDPRSEPDTH